MLHVGYYIVGKERNVPIETMEDQCERDPSHDNDIHNGDFCVRCGAMIVTVQVTHMQTLNIYDIPEDEGSIEDHFLFPEYAPTYIMGQVIGISNYNGCGHFEPVDGVIIDLDDIALEKERQYEEFMERHTHDIDLLRKYVYDDVEIKYGMFEYDY